MQQKREKKLHFSRVAKTAWSNPSFFEARLNISLNNNHAYDTTRHDTMTEYRIFVSQSVSQLCSHRRQCQHILLQFVNNLRFVSVTSHKSIHPNVTLLSDAVSTSLRLRTRPTSTQETTQETDKSTQRDRDRRVNTKRQRQTRRRECYAAVGWVGYYVPAHLAEGSNRCRK